MKKLVLLFIATTFFSLLSSAGVVTTNGRLKVSGNKIVNSTGVQVQFKGMSFFWSNTGWGGEKFYNTNTVNTLVDDWGCSILRVAMGVNETGGYIHDKSNEARVIAVVDACIAKDIYVIIDWHSHYAHDYTDQAKDFFGRMALKYKDKPHVMFEIFNEPLEIPWSTIKWYAEQVIPEIRKYSESIVMVGTATWSQKVKAPADNPITSSSNIAYVFHFYAGSHAQWLRNDCDYALNKGIALVCTEWGTCHSSGNGDYNPGETDLWIQYMDSKKISHMNWSVNDKPETASAITPGGNLSSLTESGKKVKGILANGKIIECITKEVNTKIEAENYCAMNGLQNEACSEGGQNIGFSDAGDWAEYEINIPAAGEYSIILRVAANTAGNNLQIDTNQGATILASVSVPSTSGWQNWVNVNAKITFASAGKQKIGINFKTGGVNINYFTIESAVCSDNTLSRLELTQSSTSISIGAEATFSVKGFTSCKEVAVTPSWSSNAPNGVFKATAMGTYTVTATSGSISKSATITVSDIPAVAPVIIEAETYSFMSGVTKESCSEGGQNIASLAPGDWMSFDNIDIPKDGKYTVEFRVASTKNGATINLEQNTGTVKLGNATLQTATGSSQTWSTIKTEATLKAGKQTFGIGVANNEISINWIKFTYGTATPLFKGEKALKATLFPNPCKTVLNIKSEEAKYISATIFSADGQIETTQNFELDTIITIDVQHISQGVHIIRLTTVTGEIDSYLFMKR